MNNIVETILKRRSTRVFKEESVDEETIREIVKAGVYAPSGHNMQPWHFTVITNGDILNALSMETKELNKEHSDDFIRQVSNNEKYHVFYNAPVGIIVSGDPKAMTLESDLAAASENILLAAEGFGLGACWIGFIKLLFQGEKGEEWKKKLNIPEEYTPMHGLVIGHKKVENNKIPERNMDKINFIK